MNTFTRYTTFQDWLRTAYQCGQIEVKQVGDSWTLVCPGEVLDAGLSWLLQRADIDDATRTDFVLDELCGEATNAYYINVLFKVAGAAQDERSFLAIRDEVVNANRIRMHDYLMENHFEWLMSLSGQADVRTALANQELQELHADADSQGILMSGRSANSEFDRIFGRSV